ncbi:MAG TPA: ATP phosphoribosyltransferase, partial [Thermoclostridium caenicola]|nr:ATP phosphoribosyltransferase [Thermoclostridium caenicola]
MRYITIALSKGRLTELSIDLLEGAGLDCSELKENSRKLILSDEKNKVRFFLAKPADVPVYVEYGAADIGIVGKDTLLEEGRDLYEVLNLGFAKCRMCV